MASLRQAKEHLLPKVRLYSDPDTGAVSYKDFKAACLELEMCSRDRAVKEWWKTFHDLGILKAKNGGRNAQTNQWVSFLAPEYTILEEPAPTGIIQEVHT